VQSSSCGRSNRNYPKLIAARFELKLVDVTCGAATISNVLDTPQGAAPPQINAVTPDTKLVTITVGGNDIAYNGTAVACGDPTSVCTAPAGLDASVASTRVALKTLIDKVKAAAPEATIVFVTYPREVPADKNCPALSYTDKEAAIIRSMGEKLEALFVDVVKPTGVVFVDPYVAPGDHTGCAPAAERWTAGRIPDDGFAYHPTALGHEVMAAMIVKALGD
jgi:lysophospholipase L1-like esterase